MKKLIFLLFFFLGFSQVSSDYIVDYTDVRCNDLGVGYCPFGTENLYLYGNLATLDGYCYLKGAYANYGGNGINTSSQSMSRYIGPPDYFTITTYTYYWQDISCIFSGSPPPPSPPIEPNEIITNNGQDPFVNLCNFTNLERVDWTKCNNFDTNISTGVLNINFQKGTGSIFGFSGTLNYFRENDLIGFDTSFSIREQMGDSALFYYFANAGIYDGYISLDYLSYTGVLLQDFQVISNGYTNLSNPSYGNNIDINSLDYNCDRNLDNDISIGEGLYCPIIVFQSIVNSVNNGIKASYDFIIKIKDLSPDLSFNFIEKTNANDDVNNLMTNLGNKSPYMFSQMETWRNIIIYGLIFIVIIMGAMILINKKE